MKFRIFRSTVCNICTLHSSLPNYISELTVILSHCSRISFYAPPPETLRIWGDFFGVSERELAVMWSFSIKKQFFPGVWRTIQKYRREGKGRHCCLEDLLECRTNHLAERMIWKKVIRSLSIFGWAVVWYYVNRMIIYFSKQSFHPVANILFILFSTHPGAK